MLPVNNSPHHEEAAQLWMQGKSLVIYQALKRMFGNAEEQIQAHADQLRNALGIMGQARQNHRTALSPNVGPHLLCDSQSGESRGGTTSEGTD